MGPREDADDDKDVGTEADAGDAEEKDGLVEVLRGHRLRLRFVGVVVVVVVDGERGHHVWKRPGCYVQKM